MVPNPFLGVVMSEVFGFDGERAIRFLIDSRFERSIVTSLGFMLQKLCKTLLPEGTGVAGADVQLEVEGHVYYIQIKSGPNTVDRDICENISRNLFSACLRHGGDHPAHPLLGICYGTRAQVNPWPAQFNLPYKVGEEFWRFISEGDVGLSDAINFVKDVARDMGFKDFRRDIAQSTTTLRNNLFDTYMAGDSLDWSQETL